MPDYWIRNSGWLENSKKRMLPFLLFYVLILGIMSFLCIFLLKKTWHIHIGKIPSFVNHRAGMSKLRRVRTRPENMYFKWWRPVAGIYRTLQLSRPCQDRRYGSSGQANESSITVQITPAGLLCSNQSRVGPLAVFLVLDWGMKPGCRTGPPSYIGCRWASIITIYAPVIYTAPCIIPEFFGPCEMGTSR
jgi:hypothetical protein